MLQTLPFDILLLILDYLPLPSACYLPDIQIQENDANIPNALYCCSLVNYELSRAAGRVLYRFVRLHLSRKGIRRDGGVSLYHAESEARESSWKNWSGGLAYDIDDAGKNDSGDNEDSYGLPAEPHPLLSAVSLKSVNSTYTYVQHLHVTGHLSTLPPGPTTNLLPKYLADAIRLFTSGSEARLQSLRFTPEECHPQTFVESLRVLARLSELGSPGEGSSGSSPCRLRELHLNQLAFDDEEKVQLLARIGSSSGSSNGGSLRLRNVMLENPTRVLLQGLVGATSESALGTEASQNRGWLYRLQHELCELHFMNNCGSITPGVLRSFVPYLHHLNHLTVGLSYSLEDKDVFGVLAQLANLKKAGVRWYLQLNSPPPSVFIEDWPLRQLEWLEVRYSSRALRSVLLPGHAYYRDHVHGKLLSDSPVVSDALDIECPLCAWVAKVAAGSPKLKDVVFIDEDGEEDEDEMDSDDGSGDGTGESDSEDEEEDREKDEEDRAVRLVRMMREIEIRKVGLGLGGDVIEEEAEEEEA